MKQLKSFYIDDESVQLLKKVANKSQFVNDLIKKDLAEVSNHKIVITNEAYFLNDIKFVRVSRIIALNPSGTDYSKIPEKVLQNAISFGVEIHKAIEEMVKGEKEYYELLDKFQLEPIKLKLIEAFNTDFFIKYKNKFRIESEKTLFDHNEKIAGTIDLLVKVDGITQIFDIKTRNYDHKSNYESETLQMYAYARLLRANGYIVRDYAILLILDKKSGNIYKKKVIFTEYIKEKYKLLKKLYFLTPNKI